MFSFWDIRAKGSEVSVGEIVHFYPRIAFLCLVLGQATSFAQSSHDYAAMGRSLWAGFKCSALASKMNSPKEQERLFQFGYKEGLVYLNALQSQKIDQIPITDEAPIAVLLRLQGPTPDFMLGRIYEAAVESALKDVMRTGGNFNPEDLQKTLAQNEFNKQNCRLLGRGN